MLTLDSVALLELDKFFLNLLGVSLHIIENSLVDCESFVNLRETLGKIFILVFDFVF